MRQIHFRQLFSRRSIIRSRRAANAASRAARFSPLRRCEWPAGDGRSPIRLLRPSRYETYIHKDQCLSLLLTRHRRIIERNSSRKIESRSLRALRDSRVLIIARQQPRDNEIQHISPHLYIDMHIDYLERQTTYTGIGAYTYAE